MKTRRCETGRAEDDQRAGDKGEAEERRKERVDDDLHIIRSTQIDLGDNRQRQPERERRQKFSP